MHAWTLGDLAALTVMALDLGMTDGYCEHCTVVPVAEGDKYCDGCANEVCEYLAMVYMETMASERGWY